VDKLEITAELQGPVLMLPKGAFVLEVQDALGHTIHTLQVSQP
jgi:hypothetical protein